MHNYLAWGFDHPSFWQQAMSLLQRGMNVTFLVHRLSVKALNVLLFWWIDLGGLYCNEEGAHIYISNTMEWLCTSLMNTLQNCPLLWQYRCYSTSIVPVKISKKTSTIWQSFLFSAAPFKIFWLLLKQIMDLIFFC